jgi:hypothetical protein
MRMQNHVLRHTRPMVPRQPLMALNAIVLLFLASSRLWRMNLEVDPVMHDGSIRDHASTLSVVHERLRVAQVVRTKRVKGSK